MEYKVCLIHYVKFDGKIYRSYMKQCLNNTVELVSCINELIKSGALIERIMFNQDYVTNW